jgi:hypothetical protein
MFNSIHEICQPLHDGILFREQVDVNAIQRSATCTILSFFTFPLDSYFYVIKMGGNDPT